MADLVWTLGCGLIAIGCASMMVTRPPDEWNSLFVSDHAIPAVSCTVYGSHV